MLSPLCHGSEQDREEVRADPSDRLDTATLGVVPLEMWISTRRMDSSGLVPSSLVRAKNDVRRPWVLMPEPRRAGGSHRRRHGWRRGMHGDRQCSRSAVAAAPESV